MDNKKIALIVSALIVFIFLMAGLIGIAAPLPFIGKAIALILALILAGGILLVFILAGKRKRK